MKKNKMVARIKAIIAEWGTVTTGELQLDCSPAYSSIGDETVGLVERFNAHDVGVDVYSHDVETDSFDVPYEKLSNDLLSEILEILEEYDAGMDKTMKRCQD